MSGIVATFYSYKGGVGRTFALANTAVILAQWGLRVLAVDWDIEAPGLDSYFSNQLPDTGDGVLEFLTDCRDDAPRSWSHYTVSVALPNCAGSLRFMPAANARTNYARTVQELNWESLYAEHDLGRHLEALRESWIEQVDIVLIDSRTGLTDFSGVTTVQLPDLLLFFFTANRQSLDGCCDIARRAVEARKSLPVDRPTLVTVPIPARFELRDEYDRASEWRKRFTKALAPFFSGWVPTSIDAATMVDQLLIPYVPRWSFGEELAALTEVESPTSGIRSASYPVSYAIETVAALLAHRAQRLELFRVGRDEFVLAARAEIERRRARGTTSAPLVFISHTFADRQFVVELVERLAQSGITAETVATRREDLGTAGALQELVSDAALMVFVVGPEVSRMQTAEAETFIRSSLRGSRDRRVIPVILPGRSDSFRATSAISHFAPFEVRGHDARGPQLARLVTQIVEALPLHPSAQPVPQLRVKFRDIMKSAHEAYASNKYETALRQYEAAFAIAEPLLDRPYSTDLQVRDYASALEGVGDMQRRLGDLDAAYAAYERALLAVEQSADDHAGTLGWMLHLARVLRRVSEVLRDRTELRSALTHAERAKQVLDMITPSSQVADLGKV